MSIARLTGGACIVALLISQRAAAHDFWIEPASFHTAPGSVLPVSLHVGEHLVGKEKDRSDERIIEFVAVDSSGGKHPVVGRDGKSPAGMVKIPKVGPSLVGYHCTPAFIELEADLFSRYLAMEGLDHIIKHRADTGQSRESARERYRRCAKALLTCTKDGMPGTAVEEADAGLGHRFGFPLEIMPIDDPRVSREQSTSFRVLFGGKPLENAMLMALSRAQPDRVLKSRTDAKGAAAFKLDDRGMWLVKVVHMIPVEKAEPGTKAVQDESQKGTKSQKGTESQQASMDNAQWESFWASLTFEIS